MHKEKLESNHSALRPQTFAACTNRSIMRLWFGGRGATAAPGKRKLLPPVGGAIAGAPPDHMLFGGVTVPKLKTLAR